MLLYEACGLYAVRSQNARLGAAYRMLGGEGYLRSIPHRLYSLEDVPKNVVARASFAQEFAWEPCFSAKGGMTELWKRPPLLTLDAARTCARDLEDVASASRVIRAAKIALPGSASPAESMLALMLTASRHIGGEHLRGSHGMEPLINHRIEMPGDVADALGHPSCVVDQLWPSRKRGVAPLVVEMDGWLFHDRTREPLSLTQRDDGARANALRNCGYEVIPVTYSQMANLDRWEVLVSLLAEKLDVGMPQLTPAFIKQRARLRQELFGVAPKHCVGWGD